MIEPNFWEWDECSLVCRTDENRKPRSSVYYDEHQHFADLVNELEKEIAQLKTKVEELRLQLSNTRQILSIMAACSICGAGCCEHQPCGKCTCVVPGGLYV